MDNPRRDSERSSRGHGDSTRPGDKHLFLAIFLGAMARLASHDEARMSRRDQSPAGVKCSDFFFVIGCFVIRHSGCPNARRALACDDAYSR